MQEVWPIVLRVLCYGRAARALVRPRNARAVARPFGWGSSRAPQFHPRGRGAEGAWGGKRTDGT